MKKTVWVILFLLVMSFMVGAAYAAQGGDLETARKYLYSGKYKEAVRHLQDYLAHKPDAAASYMLGYSLYKLKRFDEANEYFRDAYLLDPSFSPSGAAATEERPVKRAKPRARQTDVKPAGEAPAAKKEATETAPKQAPAAKAAEPKKAEPAKPAAAPATQPKQEQPKPGTPAEQPKAATPPAGAAKTAAPAQPQPAPAATPQAGTTPQPAAPQQPVPAAPGQQTATPAPGQAGAPSTAQPAPPAPLPPLPMDGKKAGAMGVLALLAGGFFAGFALVALAIALAIYLFFCLCMYKIATRLKVPAAWTAWIPLLNLWAFVGSAGKPWPWILIFFAPIVGTALAFINPMIGGILSTVTSLAVLVVVIYLWMCIVENLGRNKWLGLLMLLPIINIVFLAILAFSKETAPESAHESAHEPEELE